MKISNLTIKNYKQFKDLTLDLIYPKGHEKEGQPLDKICIIGQSGTGKTNLLDIIKKSVIDFNDAPTPYKPFPEFKNKFKEDECIVNKFITKNKTEVKTLFTYIGSDIFYQDIKILENEKIYFLGIKTESLSSHHKNKLLTPRTSEELKLDNFLLKKIININDKSKSWELLKERIDKYKENEQAQKSLLFNKIMNDESFSKEESILEMKNWQKNNENILEKISLDINLILKKFNLELTKIDENQQDYNSLTIKDLSNDTILEYDDLSTGTKNLLSTFIPLKSFSPKDSIILIDEPEMSFYPDIQKKLVDLYTNVGENNQLILATHSPIIASSFEPWEIVELKFDEDNQIRREKYYDDENHIDNYTLDPRMLTWTGILMDIFDLKEDSNFSVREQGLMAYATLKAEIKALSTQEEKLEKLPKLQKLSKKLGLDN